jgi:hypothetical protein
MIGIDNYFFYSVNEDLNGKKNKLSTNDYTLCKQFFCFDINQAMIFMGAKIDDGEKCFVTIYKNILIFIKKGQEEKAIKIIDSLDSPIYPRVDIKKILAINCYTENNSDNIIDIIYKGYIEIRPFDSVFADNDEYKLECVFCTDYPEKILSEKEKELEENMKKADEEFFKQCYLENLSKNKKT